MYRSGEAAPGVVNVVVDENRAEVDVKSTAEIVDVKKAFVATGIMLKYWPLPVVVSEIKLSKPMEISVMFFSTFLVLPTFVSVAKFTFPS